MSKQFWLNALISAGITALAVGLGAAAALLSTGSIGEKGEWVIIGATTLGAFASALRTALTTLTAPSDSGTFL